MVNSEADLEILKENQELSILGIEVYRPTQTLWSMTPESEFLFEYRKYSYSMRLPVMDDFFGEI